MRRSSSRYDINIKLLSYNPTDTDLSDHCFGAAAWESGNDVLIRTRNMQVVLELRIHSRDIEPVPYGIHRRKLHKICLAWASNPFQSHTNTYSHDNCVIEERCVSGTRRQLLMKLTTNMYFPSYSCFRFTYSHRCRSSQRFLSSILSMVLTWL